ncbi:MAG: L-histidine N(alpha)-methyltransferase [Terriglobales bacterium]
MGAYHDELGLMAAFNLNLLGRVRRELRADFDSHESRAWQELTMRRGVSGCEAAGRRHSGGRSRRSVPGGRDHMDGKQSLITQPTMWSRESAPRSSAAKSNESISSGLLPKTCLLPSDRHVSQKNCTQGAPDLRHARRLRALITMQNMLAGMNPI